MAVSRTFDILERLNREPPKEDILAGKQNGKWVTYSTPEYAQYADYVSYGLLSMGYKKGDKIATIANNRPEWNFVDMGMAQAGIVHVPIYPTISQEDYRYILNHSEVKGVIISNKNIYNKVRPIIRKSRKIRDIFSFDEVEGTRSWVEIIEAGRNHEGTYRQQVREIRSSIDPDEMVTLIYTSGTTGDPKGGYAVPPESGEQPGEHFQSAQARLPTQSPQFPSSLPCL
ncbi:MAG: AMP-binding protein [Bacteroidales bacterium]|nr:AMP-binding protein [Bacteroidales bacterium]